MRIVVILMTLVVGSAMPLTAATYIGPGAGLGLLAAVWALLVAVLTAIAFVVAWPIRRLLLRRRQARGES